MTQNDGKEHMNEKIKAIGRQAGFVFIGDGVYGQRWYASKCGMDASEFEKFAELITQHEREACAQIAEYKLDNKGLTAPDSPKEWWNYACQNIRDAIRARGQA